jgi:peptidyl-prolyl cis-trans isomerase C
MTHAAHIPPKPFCWKRLVTVFLVISIAVFCVSCRQKPAPENTEAQDTGTEKPQLTIDANMPSSSDIAVKINGFEVTNEVVDAVLAPYMKPFIDKASELPDGFLEQRRKDLRKQVLEQIIILHLFDEQAQKAGIKVTDEDVDDRIFVEAVSQEPEMTVEEYLEKVQADGKTVEQFKAATKRQIAHDQLVEKEWAKKINVSDEEAKAFFDENSAKFQYPERVRASHILIEPEESEDADEAKAAAQAKALQLLEQVRTGADFAELAKAHSSCSSAENGGNIDYFPRGKMVPAFEKAAFALKPGEISDLVETKFGYHIIQVTDHNDPGPIPFAEVKDRIVEAISSDKQTNFIKAYIEMLKSAADIVYVDAQAK